jgi:hypothetical protein
MNRKDCDHKYEEVDYPVTFGFSLILDQCNLCGYIKPDPEACVDGVIKAEDGKVKIEKACED